MTEAQAPARYAPPLAVVADVQAMADAGLPAKRSRRLLAVLVDPAVLLSLGAALSDLMPGVPWSVGDDAPALSVMLSGALFNGLFLLINGYSLVRRGQTLGKMALRLRIVGMDGQPAPWQRVIGLRYVVAGLPDLIAVFGRWWAIGECLTIFAAQRRCVHDYIAGTRVVNA